MPLERVKSLVGRVVSNRMMKTVVVAVEVKKRHPLYKKLVRSTKRYKVHDENNECEIGDTVRIIEGRPLSKEKRWRVIEITARGKRAPEAKEEV